MQITCNLLGVGSSRSGTGCDGVQHGVYRLSSQPQDDTTVW